MGKLHKLYFEIPPTDFFQNPKILCHLYGQKDGMMRWHILISDIVFIHSMYCIKPNITSLLLSMMPAITKMCCILQDPEL